MRVEWGSGGDSSIKRRFIQVLLFVIKEAVKSHHFRIALEELKQAFPQYCQCFLWYFTNILSGEVLGLMAQNKWEKNKTTTFIISGFPVLPNQGIHLHVASVQLNSTKKNFEHLLSACYVQ